MLNLDQDFIFLENPRQYPFSLFPYRTRHLIATLCLKGSATGEINLRKYEVSQDGFILILPGQIVESASLSEDFEGKVLMMSQRFTDSLDIIGSFSLTSAVERHPYFIFPKEAIDTIKGLHGPVFQNDGSGGYGTKDGIAKADIQGPLPRTWIICHKK